MGLRSSFRAKRAYIAIGTLMGGFLAASFLVLHLGWASPLAILAIILATVIGIGKLASP